MILLFIVYLLINFIHYTKEATPSSLPSLNCQPIYVRWPRVKLNNQIDTNLSSSIIENNLSFSDCQNFCNFELNPFNKNKYLQCSAINYFVGLTNHSNTCQLFSSEYVQHTDGYMEADDRYTFYWKFCLETSKRCTGEYAFTFFSDRYMLSSDVIQIKFTSSLEECLALCLNSAETSKSNVCKSVSFNRTDGGCHLSSQNQHSKPTSIRINNNPNYRIDYYENNCYNNSFTFTSNCEPTGIRITVDSLIPYTGALYGLYDFFSCRVEPKEQQHFELFFPYPNYAKNCSDSMRRLENDIFLEVVLSTDGVEPLYFITADDLTYQARCPAPTKQRQITQESYSTTTQLTTNQTTTSPTENLIKNNYIRGNSINAILEELANSATTTTTNNSEEEENKKDKKLVESSSSSEEIQKNNEFSSTASGTTTKINLIGNTKQKNEFTKDTFSLPLYSILQNEFSETTTKINNDTSSTFLQPFQPTTTPQQLPSEIEIETTMITFLPKTTSTLPLENKNGSSSTIKRRRPPTIGMESFFEEEEEKLNETFTTILPLQITEQQQIITSTPQINNKTTTKRSINYENINNLEAQNREFSFSTHLAFPPDKIFISTRNNNYLNNKNDEQIINTTTNILINSTINPQSTIKIPTTIKKEEAKEEVYSKMEVIKEKGEEINKNKEKEEEKRRKENKSELNKSEEIKKSEFKEETEATPITTTISEAKKAEELKIKENKSEIKSELKSEATQPKKENNLTTTPITVLIKESSKETLINETTLPPPPSTNTAIASSTTSPKLQELGENLKGMEKEGEQYYLRISGDVHPPSTSFGGNKPPGTQVGNIEERRGSQREKVIFEVFHNGQPADAVVVGSRITLAFTPYFAIPPSHMSISGCQVEPIGSLYDWEKEPLAIVKDGCQADHVGLVCPPQKTDYGIRVTVEAFRYQTTTQVQYTCLIRVCPFAPCPQTTCPSVEGCPGDDIVSRTLGSFGGRKRSKRFNENGKKGKNISRRDTVHWLAGSQRQRDQPFKMSSALQQQLILLGGDSLVRRRLIVVNSDDELRYYTRTGEILIRSGFY
uniref:Uncharacterized protein n=1 Tax=Meloidogyne enterolobii TaxID=390850 RepID=A0A6V7VA61_MELEN|nr:unnamed protein product [Meloidogyne enterolobii]